MYFSEMRRMNESLHDMHRRERIVLFDFYQNSSSKTNALSIRFLYYYYLILSYIISELLYPHKTLKLKIL